MERLVEMCSLEMFLLQIVSVNDNVIIIADTRHTQRWSERMVTPATEASMMAVEEFSKIFDLGKKGLQLTDDSVIRLKNLLRMVRTSFSHTFHFRATTWRDLLRCVRSKCSCYKS